MKPSPVAIVGMAGRFPGASNVSRFWQNLLDAVECICERSDAELLGAGATPEDLANPDYVKRAAILDNVPMFDASFFGFSPRDASIMDPQHRHFLECAWEALEDAGHPPREFDGAVGVFAGSGMNTYLIHNLLASRRLVESAGLFQLKQTGNDKDVLATRVSYQLDLRGPSINVQTACSTSLVAVHLACQSLLNYECDLALAGGVTIEIPHGLGYIHRDGEILSRDGHCRSFDAAASGTVFGSGVGIVVLRRLDEALADGDYIRAVIIGSAINNDGARKVGYLAPSVEGQADVIAEALEVAGVNAGDISYVETHGTGTVVGDPIEVRALTQAFRRTTTRSEYCGIGSVKSNVGHLDAAAGVAGLIKTVLALEHAQLPASLHFRNANPHIEMKGSPFYVNGRLADWPGNPSPRRAGVTSLGIGGTNAHLVLEEAPRPEVARATRPCELLTLSAKSEAAADRSVDNLAAHLEAHPELKLADVAFTCQRGRHAFPHRRAFVVDDSRDPIAALRVPGRKQIASGVAAGPARQVVFMFPGQGSQYVTMGRELYDHEPVFREALDSCAQLLREPLGLDLIQALYPPAHEQEVASRRLDQTWLTQPALFSIEYSLALWWMSLGIVPAAMVGHSIGEYVAACLAGVFSVADALAIAAFRGRLIYDMPGGSMLAVPVAADELHLDAGLSLAAVNSSQLCVVSGPTPDIAALEQAFAAHSVACRRLHTSHAFHSAMMDPVLDRFEERLNTIAFMPPRIPYLSNLSGTWVTAEQAMAPAYWARHLRQTVRFSECLSELSGKPGQVLLEVGPGNALTSLAHQQGGASAIAFQSLPHPREDVSSLRCALHTLGRLWVSGVDVDWAKMHAPGSAHRVPLPTYPFERQKFWIEPDKAEPAAAHSNQAASSSTDVTDQWLYQRVWKPAPAAPTPPQESRCWVIFNDSLGLGHQVAARLRADQQDVIVVNAGGSYKQSGAVRYTIRPDAREDYDALLSDLIKTGYSPRTFLHLWSVTSPRSDAPALEETLKRSFYSPLYLAQSLAAQDSSAVDLVLVSNGLHQVSNEPVHAPARAVLLGPARVIPKELPGIRCRSIDVELESSQAADACAAQIIAEIGIKRDAATIALRHGDAFTETLEHFSLTAAPERRRLERQGVYLITGGFGGIALVVAEQLAREFRARLILMDRSALPPETEWEASLSDPGKNEASKQTIRKLIELRSLSGGLLVAQGDVTDLAQVRATVDMARRQFGRIDGVFHAAGVLDDGPLVLKTREAAARVIDPKVRGTLVLEEALRGEALGCFVLFSSISSIASPAGQVDYAAANAFLDAFALGRKDPVTVVNWGAWRGVGMATRSASSHPLLQQRLLQTPREIAYASRLSAGQQWPLSEHRLKTGKALLPGTVCMEMAREAFARGTFHDSVEFRDVFFLVPLTFESSESGEVRVQLRHEQEGGRETGAYRFSVIAQDGDWNEHSTGSIGPCLTRPAAWVNRSEIAARCQERELQFDEQHRTRQERYLDFGPRWRCLRKLQIGKREALATLALDDRFSEDVSTYRMHPALFDLATGCSLYLVDGYEHTDDLYLPFSYKKICVYRPFPSRLFSHIRPRSDGVRPREAQSFDITIFDEQDRVLAEIEDFTMRRVADPGKTTEQDGWARDSAHSNRERPVEIVDGSGIPPLDGARILTRILLAATPAAGVVVCQTLEDVNSRSATSDRTIGPAALNQGIEETLTGWWQELLGVEKVGLDDDFFDLGGHSLVGVRLFAKIKKAYGLQLQLAGLFDARTVRHLADLIRESQHSVSAPQKAPSCLVPIQPNGSRIPFFCVHAIGGDVLFYERLAKALGPGQPFYAFRSPLVSGAESSETSLEELASAYIREMRAFLPEGPYLMGGLSYGGLVAFEMAQQLYAQGVEPRLLVMFDTFVPGTKDLPAPERFQNFWRDMRQQGPSYLARRAAVKRKDWGTVLSLWACSPLYRLMARELPAGLRYLRVQEAHRRALERYQFRTYPGKVTLMRAVDSDDGRVQRKRRDPAAGWQRLATGGVEVHDVPAGHSSMLLEPCVSHLAEMLKNILSRPDTVVAPRQPA